MQKAGGIIALVAGILGVMAAFFTLLLGGMAGAFDARGAAGLEWGGVAFSSATIILGAVAIRANSRVPGALIMICAVIGAILSGTFVALFMVLAFIGGLLATIGVKKVAIET